jgi:hypothetical protein
LRGQYDALRSEKDAEVAAARRETRALDESLRDLRKQQERLQGAAAERDAVANQRYAALATRAQGLQRALETARDEAESARADAGTRGEQLAASLGAARHLRSQLHICLGLVGAHVDPYQDTPVNPTEAAELARASAAETSFDLAAEVSLLRSVTALGEQRLVAQASVIERMTEALAALRESVKATSGSGAALAAALADSKAALAVAQADLARERSCRALDQEEVRRLQGTVTLAVATRREIQALGERERRAVEEAAQQRVAEATAQLLMAREDAGAEACEAWALERANYRAASDLAQLEMDGLSRAAVDLRNERNNLDEEAVRLRAELTRAAERIVRQEDAAGKPT